MPTPRKAPRFGGSPAHHKLIMSNLATELFRHGRIRTTKAKAKTVQPLAEKMITFAKRGDVHARRQVLKVVRDKDVVHKLFADVGPAFAERDGGYTRVLKLGPRKGDAAEMALIELVEGVEPGDEGGLAEAPRRRWSLRRRRGGTLSTAAQEREEETAAAYDRGEEDLLGDEEEFEDEPLDEGSADTDEDDSLTGAVTEDVAAEPPAAIPTEPPGAVAAGAPDVDDDRDDVATEAPDEGPTGVAVEPPEARTDDEPTPVADDEDDRP